MGSYLIRCSPLIWLTDRKLIRLCALKSPLSPYKVDYIDDSGRI